LFLDIDGVLNENGPSYDMKDEYFEKLSRIIKATEAKIVLSSSRRFSYLCYKKYGRESVTEETLQFIDMLKKYELEILDITDELNGGATSRPREILKWLIKCDDHKINAVGSICILDDDSGFAWGILAPYVVLTRIALSDEEYQKKRDKFPKDGYYYVDKYDYGISEDNVQQAIDILNNNPYLEKRRIDVNWR
jgi:hypothetical protein